MIIYSFIVLATVIVIINYDHTVITIVYYNRNTFIVQGTVQTKFPSKRSYIPLDGATTLSIMTLNLPSLRKNDTKFHSKKNILTEMPSVILPSDVILNIVMLSVGVPSK
jgi:hypothetical protein